MRGQTRFKTVKGLHKAAVQMLRSERAQSAPKSASSTPLGNPIPTVRTRVRDRRVVDIPE